MHDIDDLIVAARCEYMADRIDLEGFEATLDHIHMRWPCNPESRWRRWLTEQYR